MHRVILCLLVSASLSACKSGAAPVSPAKPGASPRAGEARALPPVVGSIVAPPGLVAAGAGNMVAAGAGNMVSPGGGNMVAAGAGNMVSPGGGNLASADRVALGTRGGAGFRLAAVDGKPLAGCTVQLVDAARRPLPGVAPARTDANGRYKLAGVAPGTYLVVALTQDASERPAPLVSVVKVGGAGATADLDMASTFVAVAVTEGRDASLDTLDPTSGSFRRTLEATRTGLTEADIPALSDVAAMLSRMEALAREVAEIKDGLAAVGRQVADLQAQIAEIKKRLGAGGTPLGVGASAGPFVAPSSATPFAGGPDAGFVDGAPSAARFGAPTSPIVDVDGNVFVADPLNHAIRRVAPDGVVTTVAGVRPAQAGYLDDVVAKALLNGPTGIAIELGPTRSFFIADGGNHVLRGLNLDAAGGARLVTAAGTGRVGTNDEGDPGPATMRTPHAVAVARDGTVFVADREAASIRYMRQGQLKTCELTGEAAKLVAPVGLAAGAGNRLFVADGRRLLRLTFQAPMRFGVDELGGGYGELAGLSMAPNGSLLVAEPGARRFRVVDPDSGQTTHTFGASAVPGASHLQADFGEVTGVAAASGGVYYVSDRSTHRLWKLAR